MTSIQTFPLFPLNTVLFPAMPMPLHVFEDRYKQMIDACLDGPGTFGVALLHDLPEVGVPIGRTDWSTVGTLAQIVSYEKLPDARYAINTRGIERFRVDRVCQTHPYLIVGAFMAPLAGGSDTYVQEQSHHLHALFDRFQLAAQAKGLIGPRRLPVPADAERLAWFVAATAPLASKVKQDLLEMESLAAVLDTEIRIIRACLQQIEAPDT